MEEIDSVTIHFLEYNGVIVLIGLIALVMTIIYSFKKGSTKEITKRLKARLVAHHNSTVLSLALGKSSPEDWENLLKKSFEQAKMLSDFVAILMRAAFVFLFYSFFSHMSKAADFWLSKTVLGMNSILCLVLYFFIIFRLFDIINAYWLKDTSYHSSCIHKVVITILSFWISGSIAYGIHVFVRAFVSASNLFN